MQKNNRFYMLSRSPPQIRERTPFVIVSKNNTLRRNAAKEGDVSRNENNTILLRELNSENTEVLHDRGLENPASLRRQLVLPKLIGRAVASIKTPAPFSTEIDKPILHFTWTCKGPRRAKAKLEDLKRSISKLTANLR